MTNNKKQKADVQFVQGMTVKHVETKFGDIIKLGVNVENFLANEPNERGYINIEVKKGKSGNYFAIITPEKKAE